MLFGPFIFLELLIRCSSLLDPLCYPLPVMFLMIDIHPSGKYNFTFGISMVSLADE